MTQIPDDVQRNRNLGRWRRAKWIGIVFAAAVLIVLGGIWYAGKSTVDAKLAALRAEGFPTSAGELSAFYAVPDDVDDTSDLWVALCYDLQTVDLFALGTDLPIVGTGPTPIPEPGEEWAEFEAARAFLNELDEEFHTIRRAVEAGGQVRFPGDFYAGDSPVLSHTPQMRDAAQLMRLDAHVSAHDGNSAQTLQDIKGILACSEAQDAEPTMFSQTMRITYHHLGINTAEQLTPHCNWSDAELESLQSAILSADFKLELRTALCGERVFCLIAIEKETLGPFRSSNQLETLRFYEGYIDSLSEPWSVALSKQGQLADELNKLGTSQLDRLRLTPVFSLLPGTEKWGIRGAQVTARQRSANAAIAAKRYQLKHGAWPNALNVIEPRLFGSSKEPATLLTDPFDGELLRYKLEETRVMVYSVGKNKQDDGGDCDFDGPEEPLDVGFTLKK